MKLLSLKTIAAAAFAVSMMSPALAESAESAGVREFLSARPFAGRPDFLARAQQNPALRASERKLIAVSPDLPKFKPVSIYLTMGTGF